tara:strand:- start:159 stop:362 length:204 start_codon:yes stop_codon:yes gene_type:complete
MKFLIICAVLTACASTPLEKKWNDKYDPASWRKQFNECRELLYTAYPEEIQRDEWSECMNKDYAENN